MIIFSPEKEKENWLTKLANRLFWKKPIIEANKTEINPFLERTIEHWLSSTSEMGYLMSFNQLLLSEGFSICHNSRQNAFEQGKDIVAIDKSGKPHAFQLKGGNITNDKWRNGVWQEIEELINLKIVHPSVKGSNAHKSYLVTNGELEDTVRLAIVNLNLGKWKDNPLEVITYGQLLKGFVALSNNFVPQKVSNYRHFLDLYFSNGSGLIDEKSFASFIGDVLRIDENKLSNEERRRNVAAAVLYTGYIIASFKKKNNHIAIIQILTLLGSYILALAEKFSLHKKYWEESFKIIQNEIFLTGEGLQNEIQNGGLTSSADSIFINSIWDGEIGPYRRHLAATYLFAIKLAQLFEKNLAWDNVINDDYLLKLHDSMNFWGEAAIYSFILLFFYLNKAITIKDDNIFKPLIISLDTILSVNGKNGENGLLSPYYDIETAIKCRFGLLEEPIDEKFIGRSSLIKSLIDLLVRHNRRADLEKRWRGITYISQDRFVPEQLWQNFIWHCKGGDNISEFPNQTQSWEELTKAADSIDLKLIPKTIQMHLSFLPLFLLVYPHRITNNWIKFFDESIKKIKIDSKNITLKK